MIVPNFHYHTHSFLFRRSREFFFYRGSFELKIHCNNARGTSLTAPTVRTYSARQYQGSASKLARTSVSAGLDTTFPRPLRPRSGSTAPPWKRWRRTIAVNTTRTRHPTSVLSVARAATRARTTCPVSCRSTGLYAKRSWVWRLSPLSWPSQCSFLWFTTKSWRWVEMDPAEIRSLFLPCGQLDFESAVTAQNDEFKAASFRAG